MKTVKTLALGTAASLMLAGQAALAGEGAAVPPGVDPIVTCGSSSASGARAEAAPPTKPDDDWESQAAHLPPKVQFSPERTSVRALAIDIAAKAPRPAC